MIYTSPPQSPFFIHPGSVLGDSIFDGDTPNPSAWTNLDISGKVGARAVLAFIRIYNREIAGGAAAYAFRRDASSNRETRAQGFPATCGGTLNCNLQNEAVDGSGCMLVLTDDAGVFQWRCDQVDHATIMGLDAWLPVKDIN